MIVGDLSDTKRARAAEPGRSLQRQKPGDAGDGVGSLIAHYTWRYYSRTRAEELIGKRARYEGARAGTAFDVPFGEELRVGAKHRNARNSQLIR